MTETAPRTRVATAIVSAVAALAVLAVDGTLGATVYAIPVAVSLLIAAAQAAAIPLAFVRPVAAVALAAGAVIAFGILSEPTPDAPWPATVVATIAFAAAIGIAAVVARWPVAGIGWSAGVAGTLIVATVRGGPIASGAVVAVLIVFATVSLVALGGGLMIRGWRETRLLLVRERGISAAEAARRELAEERTRIARELHDIVAHGMSAIQVQAASARFRMPDLPADAAAEFDDLAGTARTAMTEMRRLLGVLRDDAEAEQAPQPGLRDLAELLERPTHGGPLTVEDRLTGGDPMDPLRELTAFRIVQESMSNVARHAPGSMMLVVLDRTPRGGIAVEVRNSAAPGIRTPPPDAGGHGLRGMKERVALVDGAVEAGPTPDGGFVVRARIPGAQKE